MSALFRRIWWRCEAALDAYWEQLTVGQSSYLEFSVGPGSASPRPEADTLPAPFERRGEPTAHVESTSA